MGEGRSVPFDVDVLDLDVGKLQECLISPLPKEKDATPVYSHKKPDPGQRRSWWDVRKINLLLRRVTDLKARRVFHEYENISSSYWEIWSHELNIFLRWHTWLLNYFIEPGEVKGPFATGAVHYFFFRPFATMAPADVRTLKDQDVIITPKVTIIFCATCRFRAKPYLQVRCADELDPLWHGLVLNEMDGDALFHHLLHVALVVCRTKLDVVVRCNQLDVFILVKGATRGYLFI